MYQSTYIDNTGQAQEKAGGNEKENERERENHQTQKCKSQTLSLTVNDPFAELWWIPLKLKSTHIDNIGQV